MDFDSSVLVSRRHSSYPGMFIPRVMTFLPVARREPLARTVGFLALAVGSGLEISASTPSLEHALLLSSLCLSSGVAWAANFLACNPGETAACLSACKAACAAISLFYVVFKVLGIASAVVDRLKNGPPKSQQQSLSSSSKAFARKQDGSKGMQEAVELIIDWVLPALVLATAVSVLAYFLRPSLEVTKKSQNPCLHSLQNPAFIPVASSIGLVHDCILHVPQVIVFFDREGGLAQSFR